MKTDSDSNNLAGRTVLTIYAHADDEVLPAAGTLSLMSKAGWNIRCLILTDGSRFRISLTTLGNEFIITVKLKYFNPSPKI